ncbi:MAG: hypothetical protein COA79_11065 [Planctomycetota bacterium]|nr:MAG: hypothetical protein COA79_11065 [Planctomycetota bacterium]
MTINTDSAVIVIGENNPLISVCGKPILLHHLKRCHSSGIKNIFILGHFTQEVLEYLHSNNEFYNTHILQDQAGNPWSTIKNMTEEQNVIMISCEHLTDINSFQKCLNMHPSDDEVLMIGDANPEEISTARPRILLTKFGQPIDILDRARGEAVWLGLAFVGPKVLENLANRKGGIHNQTLRQANIIAQNGNAKLMKFHPTFWERIDSQYLGNHVSKEILFSLSSKRNFLDMMESGISNTFTSLLNYDAKYRNLTLVISSIISLIGGFLVIQENKITGAMGLFICLLGMLISRTTKEIQQLNYTQSHLLTDPSLIAARCSIVGAIASIYFQTQSFYSIIAILMVFAVSFVEIQKNIIQIHLETPILHYHQTVSWRKYLLIILNLHKIWYLYLIFYAFNSFSYFCVFIIEIYFFYIILILQLTERKKDSSNPSTFENNL